jgi:hypothetical protein
MAKQSSNIVHQYFKKEGKEGKTLLKVNPIHLTGIEIIVPEQGEAESNEIELTSEFETVLSEEGFVASSPLEFNLYWSGLV